MLVNVTIKVSCDVISHTMTDKTPTSQRNHLPQSSLLKIERDGSSEMLTPIYQMSKQHIPGYSNIHIHLWLLCMFSVV